MISITIYNNSLDLNNINALQNNIYNNVQSIISLYTIGGFGIIAIILSILEIFFSSQLKSWMFKISIFCSISIVIMSCSNIILYLNITQNHTNNLNIQSGLIKLNTQINNLSTTFTNIDNNKTLIIQLQEEINTLNKNTISINDSLTTQNRLYNTLVSGMPQNVVDINGFMSQIWYFTKLFSIDPLNIIDVTENLTQSFTNLALWGEYSTSTHMAFVMNELQKGFQSVSFLGFDDLLQKIDTNNNTITKLILLAQQLDSNMNNTSQLVPFFTKILSTVNPDGSVKVVDADVFDALNNSLINIIQLAQYLNPNIININDVVSFFGQLSNKLNPAQQTGTNTINIINNQPISNSNTAVNVINNIFTTINNLTSLAKPINNTFTFTDLIQLFKIFSLIINNLKINTGSNANIQKDITNIIQNFNNISTLNVVGDANAILTQVGQYLTKSNSIVLPIETDSTIEKSNNVLNALNTSYNNCKSMLNSINILNENKSTQSTLVNDISTVFNQINELPTFQSGNNAPLTLLKNYESIGNISITQLNTLNVASVNDNATTLASNVNTLISNYNTLVTALNKLDSSLEVSSFNLSSFITATNTLVSTLTADGYSSALNTYFTNYINANQQLLTALQKISSGSTSLTDFNLVCDAITALSTFNNTATKAYETILNNGSTIINALNTQLNTLSVTNVNDNGNTTLNNTNTLYDNYNTIVTQTNKLDSSLNANNFNLSTFSTAINTLNTTLIANNYTSALNTYTINKYITPKSNLITYLQTVSKNTNNNTYVNDAIAICNSILTLPTFNNNVASAYSVILGNVNSFISAGNMAFNSLNSILINNDNLASFNSIFSTYITNNTNMRVALYSIDQSTGTSPNNFVGITTTMNTVPYITYINNINTNLASQQFNKTGNTNLNTFIINAIPSGFLQLFNQMDSTVQPTLSSVTLFLNDLLKLVNGTTIYIPPSMILNSNFLNPLHFKLNIYAMTSGSNYSNVGGINSVGNWPRSGNNSAGQVPIYTGSNLFSAISTIAYYTYCASQLLSQIFSQSSNSLMSNYEITNSLGGSTASSYFRLNYYSGGTIVYYFIDHLFYRIYENIAYCSNNNFNGTINEITSYIKNRGYYI